MPDLAMLGIKVDSRDVKVADKDLEKLAVTAGKTEKSTNELGKETDKTSKRFAGLSTALSAVTISMASLVAAGAGVVTMAGNMAKFGKEMEMFARLSGTTAESFQALSYAASNHGIQADKLADVYKDMQDRIGDFIQTGGGPIVDFFEQIAPKVGVTAEEFRRLSGPDGLQLFFDSLQKAGLAQSDVIFHMEALSSNSSALIPLLQNNGQEFKRLADEARELGIVIDKVSTENAAKFNDNLSTMKLLLRDVANDIGNEFIPTLNRLAEEFIDARRAGLGFWDALTGIGLSDPTKSPGEQVKQLGSEIDSLRQKLNQPHTSRARGMIQEEIDELTKLREYFKSRQRSAALEGSSANYGNESRMSNAVLPFDRVSTNPGKSGKSGASSKAQKYQQESLTAAQEAVIDAWERAQRVFEQTRTPLEKLNVELAQIDELLASGSWGDPESAEAWDVYSRAVMDAEDRFRKTTDATKELKKETSSIDMVISDGFANAASAIANFGKEGQQSFGQMIEAMIRDLIRLELQMSMMAMYKGAKDGGGGGLFGMLGNLITGGIMGGLGNIGTAFSYGTDIGSQQTSILAAQDAAFGGFRANGGPVSFGSAYVVGERGPELFMPSQSGSIVPNEKLGGGTVVNIHNAPPGTRTKTRNQGGQEFIDIFLADVSSGGPMSQAIQGAYNLGRTGR